MNDVLRDRIYASFSGGGVPLEELCGGLLSQQQHSWAELKQAYDSLNTVRSRSVECDGFSVRLVFNPGRAVNTTAAVRPEEIRERPCFLCSANLPSAQKGILYHREFLILGNPRPTVPFHLTIAHLDHRPQALCEHIETFLKITADLGCGFITLYNGPRCGASAPDHLHFQAVPSGQMPIEGELENTGIFIPLNPCSETRGARVRRATGFGREALLIEGDDVSLIAAAFRDYMDTLTEPATKEKPPEEPMINAAASLSGKVWRLLVFPRRAHRPAAFYRDDADRIVVSPAVMEMGGIIVTPVERDFDRLDANTIQSIYREVSLADT